MIDAYKLSLQTKALGYEDSRQAQHEQTQLNVL